MRIGISGTHSIGKSTFVQDFHRAHPDFLLEDEPYRQLAAEGERIHFAERASQRCNLLMTKRAIDRINELRDTTPDLNVICDRTPSFALKLADVPRLVNPSARTVREAAAAGITPFADWNATSRS